MYTNKKGLVYDEALSFYVNSRWRGIEIILRQRILC